MAIASRLISLNLGSQTIGLAEFRMQAHGGLVLQDYRFRELSTEPTSEEMRRAQIAAALREMMSELHIKHGAVNYALPAQSVFARFVKLPSLEQEKLEKVIAFEAQQNVPFPIDDVVWDYQLVGGGLDEETQVVLVAIKIDLLDEINGGVEEAGLGTSPIDVSPMALYNTFCYNYPKLKRGFLLLGIRGRTNQL